MTRLTTFDIIAPQTEDGPDIAVLEDEQLTTMTSFNSSAYPPFTFWEELRQDASLPFETQEGSSIQVVRLPASISLETADGNLTSIRLAHIASMLAVSHPLVGINNIFHNAQAAGVLALKHLNERSSSIMSDLPERMQACPDLFFTMNLYDSQTSVIHAARQFSDNISRPQTHTLAQPNPIALAGATRSLVSKTLATLAGVQGMPSISHISAADSLDNTDVYPYFCRTSASNGGMARGLAVYMYNLGEQVRHIAILYARDELGISHYTHLADAARTLGMSVFQAPYETDNPQSLDQAILKVRQSGYRYVSLAPVVSTFPAVAQRAFELGLGGEDYTFFLSEGNIDVVSTNFALNATTEYGAASVLNGTGIVLLYAPGKDEYQPSMTQEFLQNPPVMDYYTQKHPARDLFLNPNFHFDPVADAQRSNFAAALQHSQYDAVIALGLAACNSQTTFFTGPQLYTNIKNLSFTGASKIPVQFKETCSRDMQFYHYTALNLVAKPPQDGRIQFETHLAAMLTFDETLQNVNESVTVLKPHVFRDGTSIAKPSIPDLKVDMNLIPKGIQILGWILAGLVMALSLAFGIWTIWKRNSAHVRMRQPLFLGMCCAGSFILASSIIPMSLQEPTPNLDTACMSSIWLVSVGFLAAFSALFSKTWRVNLLFQDAAKFRRKTVKAKDVILPFLILSSLNLVILIVMTIVAPVEWQRLPTDGQDQYGRYLGTYGSCQHSNDKTKWFLWSLFLLNFLAVLLSNVQIFLARNLPRKLNESKDVAFSMIMLLEACLVGLPVLVIVQDSPTARFLVSTCLVVVVCLAILAPQVPTKLQRQRQVSVKATADPTGTSIFQKLAMSYSGASSLGGSVSSIRFSLRRSGHNQPPPPDHTLQGQALDGSQSSIGVGAMQQCFQQPDPLLHDLPQPLEDSIASFGGDEEEA